MQLTFYTISPTQSKVARAYLSWTQNDLGNAAGLDRSTIRSFENGFSPRRDSVARIRKALEKEGIEFTQDDGVKRHNNEIKIYRGIDSRDNFYSDIFQTIEEHGGELLCVLPSQDVFMRVFGPEEGYQTQLESLSEATKIKCLFTVPSRSPIVVPAVSFRTTTNLFAFPFYYFGYGNKHVHALEYERSDFAFITFYSAKMACDYRALFSSLWAESSPLPCNRFELCGLTHKV
ncbi:MAG: helix-turn-helix transcriptional regulator [Alphaproteobacteria bacterium]|nr:helix-turn-helix transcriptional regulator [Alphaproteobacteria bacterium]